MRDPRLLKGYNLFLTFENWIRAHPGKVEKWFAVAQRVVDPDLLPRFHMLYGAALRRLGRQDEAYIAFTWAEKLATEQGDLWCAAETLQRMAQLYSDVGDLDAGATVARRSMHEFVLQKDKYGVARAAMSLGLVLSRMGKRENAREHFDLCERLLPKWVVHGRASALQNLARSYSESGDRGMACVAAKRLEIHLGSAKVPFGRALIPPLLKFESIDFRAWILLESGNFPQAAKAFSKAFRGFADFGFHFEAALAAVPGCRALMLSGQIREAYRLAKISGSLVKHLPMNSTARRCVVTMHSTVEAGRRLTVEQLMVLQSAIRKAKARESSGFPLPKDHQPKGSE